MGEAETCAFLEDVFREHLDGQPLLAKNFVRWLNFPLVRNARWHGDDVVLLGDALHTAHFSIGSGTKLALEDAIALARAFAQRERPRARRCRCSRQSGGRGWSSISRRRSRACAGSRTWRSYMHLDPLPFAVEAMTRSKRVDLREAPAA